MPVLFEEAGSVRIAWHQHRELDVGVAGQFEGHLFEGKEPVARMVERALAALAAEHAVLLPHPREIRAGAAQFIDQAVQLRVVEMGSAMRAELSGHAADATLPIAD